LIVFCGGSVLACAQSAMKFENKSRTASLMFVSNGHLPKMVTLSGYFL
jgi:hypothetical protein